MKVKRFFAPDMRQAMKRVRDEIGPDAVIVSNHRVAGGVEVVAAHENDYEAAQQEFSKKRKKDLKRKEQVGVLTNKPDQSGLAKELQRARLQIAEAERKQDSQNYDAPGAVNRQIEQDDEDLRSILASLKERQKQKANVAHRNYMQGGASDSSYEVDDLQVPPEFSSEQLSSRQAPPHRPAQNDDSGLIRTMQDEITQLKSLLNQQVLANQTVMASAPVKSPVQKKLELLGIEDSLADHLIASMEPGLSPGKAWKTTLARLAESIPVSGEEFIDRGGMIAFVGPTGVGKTTTIGKLAARYVLKYGSSSLALVTTDTFRIAAHEQLRTFGRILDVPVRVVDSAESLDAVLHSLKNKRLVLIDTAGLNSQEPHSQAQLNMLEEVSLRLKKLLVVSCSSQKRVVEQAYNVYNRLGLDGCVLSKMDESGSLGDAISLVVEKRLPIAYVADGQRIPDDINVPSRQDLVSRAVVTAQKALEAEKQAAALDSTYKAG